MENDRRARLCLAVFSGVTAALAATIHAQAPLTPPVEVKIERLHVTITFDLPTSDPVVVFDVSLVVTDGAGQPVEVKPGSLTGDVDRLKGGKHQIVWNAGQDLDFPVLDHYTYAVKAVAVTLTGTLTVQTNPPGATVTVDGEVRGSTGEPLLTIPDLKAGPHVVVLSKPGYLDHRVDDQTAQIRAGETSTVVRTLTPEPPTAATTAQGRGTPAPVTTPKGGGMPKWIIPVAGGGAAAALLGLKGKGSSSAPGVCTFSLTPTSFANPTQTGGSAAVTVGVSAAGCSPQTWTASSASAFLHVSPTSGTGAATVTVTLDANITAATRSGSATIAGQAFTVTNQPGLPSGTSAVTGNSATFAAFPAVTVVAGQKLTITASGVITTSGNGNVGPQGIGTNAGSAGRLPGAPSFGLVCGIGGQLASDLFFAGPGSAYTSGTTAAVGGTLFCGMNAPDGASYAGNSGSWTVTVTVGG